MRVHLIKKQSIEEFISKNNQSRLSFEMWYSIIKTADWKIPGDIISTFNSADILGKSSERVVFNIGGNRYRLICKYYFGYKKIHLFVKWIGTHAQYTKLCQSGKQFKISNY
jgi:mRNA interferase HigB